MDLVHMSRCSLPPGPQGLRLEREQIGQNRLGMERMSR
jgi:hypothetical protein